jgi:hypothetical protein
MAHRGTTGGTSANLNTPGLRLRMVVEDAGSKCSGCRRVRVGIMSPVAPASDTVTLWRPTGPEELALVEASGWREWPPRLPGQPIFYPVLNEEFPPKICPP